MRRRWFLFNLFSWAALLALGAIGMPGVVLAQNRVALVIGNGVYPNLTKIPALANPPNDARALAAELRASGFDTLEVINATVHQMDDAIDRLIMKIGPQSEVVVFYAGHGIEVKGANWLLPSDINEEAVSSETRLPRAAVNLAQTLSRIQERGARFTVFILDACREDPFPQRLTRSVSSRGGLAALNPPDGVFLMYSAAPGQFANDRLSLNDKHPNSPYTRNLLELMRKDGLDLGELAKQLQERVATDTQGLRNRQRPGHYDGASGRFFFRPATARPSTPVAQAPAPAVAAVNQPQTRSVVVDDPWKKLPFRDAAHLERVRKPYLAQAGAKALAFTGTGREYWTFSTDPTMNESEIRKLALQQCEFQNRQSCYVAVIGEKVLDPGAQGFQPTTVLASVLADDAKVSASEVPFNYPSMRQKFREYARLKGHRAAAINMWSHLAWASSTQSSEEAQRKALNACQDTIKKWSKNVYGEPAPPCLVYAIEDRVVLNQRAIEPIVQPKPVAAVATAPTLGSKEFRADDVKFASAAGIKELKKFEASREPWLLVVPDIDKPSRWSARTAKDVTEAENERMLLDRCEFTRSTPCHIYARNGKVVYVPGTPRPLPRVVGTGAFSADQVAFVSNADRNKLKSYANITRTKAIAIHPWGFYGVGEGTDAAQVQSDALKACNAAAQDARDYECVLYAVDNVVVLDRRLTRPLVSPSPVSTYRPFKASEVKFVQPSSLKILSEYEALREDWALAVESATEKKVWFGAAHRGAPITQIETLALQRCELFAKTPCFLYASNGQVIDHQGQPSRRPTLIERGRFEANNVPFVLPEHRKNYEFYARLNGSKAIAIHVSGILSARTGSTADAAQREALSNCNAEAKNKWGSDCFVYAVDNEVVLHRRATKPIN